MARHNEKTSAGRAKVLYRGDTGDRLKNTEDTGKNPAIKLLLSVSI